MDAPTFVDLATDELELADGLEVVTSRVELPPGFRLPPHTHPGEEFAYVIDGAIHLWEQDAGERRLDAGTYAKVAVGTVHTVRTGDEGATLLVFRVHRQGEPERTLVDVEVG